MPLQVTGVGVDQLWSIKGGYESFSLLRNDKELTVPLLSKTLLYLPKPGTVLVICNYERNYKDKAKTLRIAE